MVPHLNAAEEPGKLIVQSDRSMHYLPKGDVLIRKAGDALKGMHASLAAFQDCSCLGYFSSVLFCCITNDWYLFQAGFWLIVHHAQMQCLLPWAPMQSSDPLDGIPLLLRHSRNTVVNRIHWYTIKWGSTRGRSAGPSSHAWNQCYQPHTIHRVTWLVCRSLQILTGGKCWIIVHIECRGKNEPLA